jgi:hypothetical protein
MLTNTLLAPVQQPVQPNGNAPSLPQAAEVKSENLPSGAVDTSAPPASIPAGQNGTASLPPSQIPFVSYHIHVVRN